MRDFHSLTGAKICEHKFRRAAPIPSGGCVENTRRSFLLRPDGAARQARIERARAEAPARNAAQKNPRPDVWAGAFS